MPVWVKCGVDQDQLETAALCLQLPLDFIQIGAEAAVSAFVPEEGVIPHFVFKGTLLWVVSVVDPAFSSRPVNL